MITTALTYNIKTPAKINLWLKITGVRENGYHELNSLFVPVSIYDELKITPLAHTAHHDEIRYMQGPHTLHFDGDTVTKAVHEFRKIRPETPFFQIDVQKHIPIAAGLGGGSSDAAAALQFLQKTYGTDETLKMLPEIALKTGADVPFFLNPTPSLITGIGEKQKTIKIENLHLVICRPPVQIAASQAYGWFDADSELTRRLQTDNNMRQNAESGMLTVGGIIKSLHNDLEKGVEKRHPEIAVLKEALRKWGALGVLMSGSGSSVFGIFENLQKSTHAKHELESSFPSDHTFFSATTDIDLQQGEHHGDHRS